MYFYIYDSFVNDKKYSSIINRVEIRLVDLGINGRTEKLTILKSLNEIVEECVKKGASTIIAVGNDSTISQIISLLPNLNITLGLIPIGKNNQIAKMLGIPDGEDACNVISARITETIDLGKANDRYFISSLSIPAQKELIMDCGSYQISPLSENNTINICNFDTISGQQQGHHKAMSSPKDGVLEAIISSTAPSNSLVSIFKKRYSSSSVFPFKKIKIKCSQECLPVVADGLTTIKTPVTVEVVPKKLKIIVGKNRMF